MVQRNALARSLGVSTDKFVNYEHGRTPLPWGIFLAMWKRYSIHPTWLVTGEGPQMLAFRGFEASVKDMNESASFFAIYKEGLAALLASAPLQTVSAIPLLESLADPYYSGFQPGTPLPPGMRFQMQVLPLDARLGSAPMFPNTLALLNSLRALESEPVASPEALLKKLRDDLRRVLSGPGKKTELAALMGVSQGAVTQWLDGDTTPSGKNALFLLHWVQQELAKLKGDAGRVAARPARKAQTKTSTVHAKKGSGPPRK
jgi:DNA-binding transcriptional regulator YiaG